MSQIDFEKFYFALKSRGMVQSKEEYWMHMDVKDLTEAGAFVPKEIWDEYIIKKDNSKIRMTPQDFTKR